jgi:hypothetical protein
VLNTKKFKTKFLFLGLLPAGPKEAWSILKVVKSDPKIGRMQTHKKNVEQKAKYAIFDQSYF